MQIILTDKQKSRLENLENDKEAKVIGTLDNCPVVWHSGTHAKDYGHVAVVSRTGRLRGLGPNQIRRWQIGRRFATKVG